MIFQELLNTCDPRRIAEIWNDTPTASSTPAFPF